MSGVMDQKKKCPCCKRLLSFDKFNKNKNRKYGLSAYCKECRQKKDAEYRKTEKYKVTQDKYHKSEKCKATERAYLKTPRGKQLHREAATRRNKSEKGKKYKREYHLKHTYGLTTEDQDHMWVEQNGCCDVCKQPLDYDEINIDHNHVTGQIRGITCKACNLLLGYAHIDELGTELLKKAIDYTKRHSDN